MAIGDLLCHGALGRGELKTDKKIGVKKETSIKTHPPTTQEEETCEQMLAWRLELAGGRMRKNLVRRNARIRSGGPLERESKKVEKRILNKHTKNRAILVLPEKTRGRVRKNAAGG